MQQLINELTEADATLANDGYKSWCHARISIGKAIKLFSLQSYPRWVKASERLPDKKGKENSVVIKNESKDNFFVTTGFVNFSNDHPAIYFELGFSSYLTVHDKGDGKTTFPIENIYWLEENPSPSTQDTYQIFKGDEVNSFLAVIMRVLNDDQKKAIYEALGERLERTFTSFQILQAAKEGEVSMVDAKHIVEILKKDRPV